MNDAPVRVNPLNAELNPICHLLALLGAHHILHVSMIWVKAHFKSGATADPNLMLTFLKYRPLTLNPLKTKRRLLYLTFWHQSFTFKF